MIVTDQALSRKILQILKRYYYKNHQRRFVLQREYSYNNSIVTTRAMNSKDQQVLFGWFDGGKMRGGLI